MWLCGKSEKCKIWLCEFPKKIAKKNEGQVLFVISNWHSAQFFCPLSILPLSLRHMTVAWFLWEKWTKLTDFDYFDWKLVVTFTCQECLVKQIVSRFRCPSDLTSFVKICAFVQLLEAVIEWGGFIGWEFPVQPVLGASRQKHWWALCSDNGSAHVYSGMAFPIDPDRPSEVGV